MVLRSFHIDWNLVAGQRVPVDADLFRLADAFAKAELRGEIDLSKVPRCWVVCRVDSEDKPVEVLAMGGVQMVPECHMFRTKRGPHASKSTKLLWDRLNAYFSDIGLGGQSVLLHIDEQEAEEGRCPRWKKWLRIAGAKSSNRVAIPIR